MNYWDITKESVKNIEVSLTGKFYDEDDFLECCEDLVGLFRQIPYFEVIIHDSNLDLNEILKLVKLSCGDYSKEVFYFLRFHEKLLSDYGIEFKQIFKYCLDSNMIK